MVAGSLQAAYEDPWKASRATAAAAPLEVFRCLSFSFGRFAVGAPLPKLREGGSFPTPCRYRVKLLPDVPGAVDLSRQLAIGRAGWRRRYRIGFPRRLFPNLPCLPELLRWRKRTGARSARFQPAADLLIDSGNSVSVPPVPMADRRSSVFRPAWSLNSFPKPFYAVCPDRVVAFMILPRFQSQR